MTEIRVLTLALGSVELPDWHPRASDGRCSIHGFVIRHPDGPILVDTGVASDNEFVNAVYCPTVVPIVTALNQAGIDERDLVAIVNTHLHFDHCGQNRALPRVPVFVQRAEIQAAAIEHYTVPEWAAIADTERRVVDGDHELAPFVRLLATPGHTPGHQSVVIDHGEGRRSAIVGQCCYTCAEFAAGVPTLTDMHDESLFDLGCQSLERLRRLEPTRAYFSHDTAIFGAEAR